MNENKLMAELGDNPPGVWETPGGVRTGTCEARLGDRRCNRPRQNKSHWENELEWHADGEGSWDDDAPGAVPHHKTAEVEALQRMARRHLSWFREAQAEIAVLKARSDPTP